MPPENRTAYGEEVTLIFSWVAFFLPFLVLAAAIDE